MIEIGGATAGDFHRHVRAVADHRPTEREQPEPSFFSTTGLTTNCPDWAADGGDNNNAMANNEIAEAKTWHAPVVRLSIVSLHERQPQETIASFEPRSEKAR